MSSQSFEQLRIPAALVLILIAAFVLLPRGPQPGSTADVAAAATPVAGRPGGAVVSSASPSEAASPTPSAVSTATPTASPRQQATPQPTAEPVAADGFSADVLACRSISGSSCNGQLGTLPAAAATFTALVLFSDARAGDAINVIVSGPGGETAGGPYTLGGGGDGYFYATFPIGGMPSGEYVLVATRNGEEVARTSFRRG